MTTLVATRQALELLSMSEQQKRRTSKRLAAATEYEQDDDFQFIRKSKRAKTEEQEPVKKTTRGRPPAKETSLKATGAKTETPKAATKTAGAAAATTNAGTTTRRSSRRKASLDAPPDELRPQPKTKVIRKATRHSKRLSGDPIAEEVETNGAVPRKRGRIKVKKDDRIEEEAEELLSRQQPQQQQRKQRHEPEPREESPPPSPPQHRVPVESAKITLPMSDTPIINRNKEMRKKGNSNRRSSLGSRGRRASSLIENGQTAIPHRDVDPSEFYKHIEADGLPEPRRMKQLLMWCGERALIEKPPLGTSNSNAILGARAIQDQLLKDFSLKSEFSNWFSRDDEPKPNVVLKPNPRNIELDEKMASLEAKVKRLQIEKKTWLEIQKPPPENSPLFLPQELETDQIELPDFDLLGPEEGKIRNSLADPAASYAAMRTQAEKRLRTFQSSLEFEVDFLADNVHKLEQRMAVAGEEADKVLKLSAARLRQREQQDREGAGTRDMPVMEVLRSLSHILPEGNGG
ncbi:hypothetical protein CDD82_3599 [Ophiocordyceps australis]|uniref:Kinetochore protein mis13 n=1 Tax=Ophiocordyceps australis TaxID=1399860 RepID=A0A2C5XNH2_9HYPO|nr:hypothetical protein CDD82_3599 [Ophiocordyceps australis]